MCLCACTYACLPVQPPCECACAAYLCGIMQLLLLRPFSARRGRQPGFAADAGCRCGSLVRHPPPTCGMYRPASGQPIIQKPSCAMHDAVREAQ